MIEDKDYWNDRYKNNQTGWDIGEASPPLIEYVEQLPNQDIKILMPGSGNSWDAEVIYNKGYKNTFIMDIAEEAIKRFHERVPSFPKENAFLADFFDHQETYDLVLEQTFFCALPPSMRKDYVKKMHEIINPGGKLVGVLFGQLFPFEGPPHGGEKSEYLDLFSPYFHIRTMETAYNSIGPRQGSELFIILEKK